MVAEGITQNSGSVVVLDPKTGDVIAISNYRPTTPQRRSEKEREQGQRAGVRILRWPRAL